MAQQTKYYTEGEERRDFPPTPPRAHEVPSNLPDQYWFDRYNGTPVYSDYDSGARQRQSELYDQIANRGPFSYNAKDDPLYGVMKDRYVQQGRMAMKDTMGQAAALTGGYGSSYGQAVGQQQYDASLQGLADVIPELYQAAYKRYADEGDRLQNLYAMAGQQADRDYQRWADERAWQYQKEQDSYSRQQASYNNLYNLILSTGYNPTDDELAAAGMTREAANALLNQYGLNNPEKTGGRGGGGGGGDGGNGDPVPGLIQGWIADGLTGEQIVQMLKLQGVKDFQKYWNLYGYLFDDGTRNSGSGVGSPTTPGSRQSQKIN